MSFQRLEVDNKARRRDIEHFLTVSAFFQPNHISESLFRCHWESTQPAPGWMRIFTRETPDRDEGSRLHSQGQVSDSNPEENRKSHPHSTPNLKDEVMPAPVQEWWRVELFWDVISRAHDLSLLNSIAGGVSVDGVNCSLHPVICDWLQVRLQPESVRWFVSEAIEVVVDSVRRMDSSRYDSLQTRTILLGHIDTCLSNDERSSSEGQHVGQELTSCVAAEFRSVRRNESSNDTVQYSTLSTVKLEQMRSEKNEVQEVRTWWASHKQ